MGLGGLPNSILLLTPPMKNSIVKGNGLTIVGKRLSDICHNEHQYCSYCNKISTK